MTTQSRLSMFVHSPVPVCFSIFLYVSFHIFDALLLFALHINRCPVFVKTFNHSHKFIQLSLVLDPAMLTNKNGKLDDTIGVDAMISK
jgi:hypothetical protein